jgi:hypothetical protein
LSQCAGQFEWRLRVDLPRLRVENGRGNSIEEHADASERSWERAVVLRCDAGSGADANAA